MEPTELQYERIALYLDGEDVHLTPDEQVLVRQVSADQEAVGDLLKATAGANVMWRARTRLAEHLGRHRVQPIHWGRYVAAAAAMLMIGFALWRNSSTSRPDAPVRQGVEYVTADQEITNEEFSALAKQLDQLQDEDFSYQQASFDDEMDELAATLTELWLVDNADIDI